MNSLQLFKFSYTKITTDWCYICIYIFAQFTKTLELFSATLPVTWSTERVQQDSLFYTKPVGEEEQEQTVKKPTNNVVMLEETNLDPYNLFV